MNKAPLQAPKRIAVVAIHGVGDPPPRETAQAVANQLLHLNGLLEPRRYDPFEEQTVRITTRPVIVRERHEAPSRYRIRERSSYIRDFHQPGQRRDLGDLDTQFAKGQLADYEGEGPAAMYDTIRLRSTRRDPAGPAIHVDILELFWGDLSRLGSGIWRFFAELYQLLFEIGSVGRKTMDFAALAHPRSCAWEITRFLQSWAVRTWTWSVPILNLLLLATVFSVLPAYILERIRAHYPDWQGIIAFAITGLMLFAALVWFGWKWIPTRRFWLWAGLPPLVAIVCAGAFHLFDGSLSHPHTHFGYHHLLALDWLLVTGTVLALIIRLYARRRPGSGGFGIVVGFLTGVAFVWSILQSENGRPEIVQAELLVVEMIFIALFVSWWAMMAAGLLAGGTGILASVLGTDPPERRRAWDALMTARMSLSLPIAIFMILTIGLYQGLYGATVYLVEGITYDPLFPWQNGNTSSVEAGKFLHGLIAISAPPLLTLLLISAVMILSVWALFPAVLSEIRTPPAGDAGSRQLGWWLTNGIRLLNWCERILFVTIFLVLPVDLLAFYLWDVHDPFGLLGNASPAVTILGAALTVSAVGLVAFRGQLQRFAAGLRPVLDVTLDVAAFLREHPRDSTPKARIYARYVSLLRHLCQSDYDALVIVAHSQGTMLTADLLRFLQKERDPALTRMGGDMPVYLFTMGSPIRQLCGARFPHLFAWATGNADLRVLVTSDLNDLKADSGADPVALGVKCWVNAYRSADYIGRFLWRSERCAYNWDAPAAKPPGDTRPWNPLLKKPVNVSESVQNGTERPRVELCLGAGGHTHYFDQPDTDVAVLLDLLIKQAAAGKTL